MEESQLVDVPVDFTGGLDEISPGPAVDQKDYLKLTNWRLTKDGGRIEKRLGLTDFGATEAAQILALSPDGTGEDIYGFTTYYNATPVFCKLLVTESQVLRKVSTGAWASIHTFASSLTHPIRVLEIQGKQFIIHENDSRVVQSDGNDYQIGIDAPTTVATLAATTAGNLTAGTYRYAFTYGRGGNFGAESNPIKSVIGAVTFTGGGLNDMTVSGTYTGTTNITVQVVVDSASDTVKISYDDGVTWSVNTLKISTTMYISNGLTLLFAAATGHTNTDMWSFPCTACAITTLGGSVATAAYTPTAPAGLDDDTVSGSYTLTTLYHVRVQIDTAAAQDTFKLSITGGTTWMKTKQNVTTTDSVLGYGVKIKWAAITGHTLGDYWTFDVQAHQIGASTFHHIGGQLDDLTTSGTYTGQNKATVKVKITTAGATDKIDISYDNGATWDLKDISLLASITLDNGVILTWGATTGHTANDYWTFICETGQQVTLSAIPTSSDGQVTYRNIYRTVINGSTYFWLARLDNNTTTTFVDNVPDSLLGSLMEEDHDVLPKGKFSCWWDNRLWVSGSNKIYYSGISKPEQFNVGYDYIDIRAGAQGDDITQMIPYQDNMYVFTKNAIYLIQQRVSGIYGRFSVRNDLGCVAPFSMVEANGILYFMSERGIEAFNGTEILPRPASLPITRTVQTLDTAKYDYICASHNFLRNEIWWSIPDATGSTTTNKAIVLNYGSGKFYVFDFHKIISFLGPARDSNKSTQIYLGTRDGLIYTADTGYLDGATAITATLRKGWWDLQKYGSVRKIMLQYEAPVGKTLTAASYVNMDKDAFNTKTLTGNTPTSTDLEIRRVVDDNWDVDCRGQFYAIELTNSENVGGDLKINHMILKVRADVKKAKIYAD